MSNKTARIDFVELGFTVIAEPNDYHVDYRIYDHDGYDCDTGAPFFSQERRRRLPRPS